MQLYAGSTLEFLGDAVQHRVAEKLGESYYQYFRFRASASEFASWQNSLTALTAHLQYSGLRDQGIVLEMQLPLTSARLDAMLTGLDGAGLERAVIVELKQWSSIEQTDVDDDVLTYLGGQLREVPHPSIQVGNYRQYLADMNSAFHEGPQPIRLAACSWLHNLDDASRSALLSEKFARALAFAPLFTGHDADAFRQYLADQLQGGSGMPILERIVGGRHAPSKKLLEHTARVIAGDPAYTLLDDQIVAFNGIMTLARRGMRAKSERAVVVVKGGPGTGKSVLALNVMGELLKEGRNVQLATGSKAFTENLRKQLGPRVRLSYNTSTATVRPIPEWSTCWYATNHIASGPPATACILPRPQSRTALRLTNSSAPRSCRSSSSTIIKQCGRVKSALQRCSARQRSGMALPIGRPRCIRNSGVQAPSSISSGSINCSKSARRGNSFWAATPVSTFGYSMLPKASRRPSAGKFRAAFPHAWRPVFAGPGRPQTPMERSLPTSSSARTRGLGMRSRMPRASKKAFPKRAFGPATRVASTRSAACTPRKGSSSTLSA